MSILSSTLRHSPAQTGHTHKRSLSPTITIPCVKTAWKGPGDRGWESQNNCRRARGPQQVDRVQILFAFPQCLAPGQKQHQHLQQLGEGVSTSAASHSPPPPSSCRHASCVSLLSPAASATPPDPARTLLLALETRPHGQTWGGTYSVRLPWAGPLFCVLHCSYL